MDNTICERVHINEIKVGDTVVYQGELKTVDGQCLKHKGFCGTTLWGDSFKVGSELVHRVEFVTLAKKE
jgi:hypothetical protein